jgi:cation transport regulator ChaB
MAEVDLAHKIEHLLTQIQQNIYQKALDFRAENITPVEFLG